MKQQIEEGYYGKKNIDDWQECQVRPYTRKGRATV